MIYLVFSLHFVRARLSCCNALQSYSALYSITFSTTCQSRDSR